MNIAGTLNRIRAKLVERGTSQLDEPTRTVTQFWADGHLVAEHDPHHADSAWRMRWMTDSGHRVIKFAHFEALNAGRNYIEPEDIQAGFERWQNQGAKAA